MVFIVCFRMFVNRGNYNCRAIVHIHDEMGLCIIALQAYTWDKHLYGLVLHVLFRRLPIFNSRDHISIIVLYYDSFFLEHLNPHNHDITQISIHSTRLHNHVTSPSRVSQISDITIVYKIPVDNIVVPSTLISLLANVLITHDIMYSVLTLITEWSIQMM